MVRLADVAARRGDASRLAGWMVATFLLALAFLGILLFYAVVVLEKIFAGWAERPET